MCQESRWQKANAWTEIQEGAEPQLCEKQLRGAKTRKGSDAHAQEIYSGLERRRGMKRTTRNRGDVWKDCDVRGLERCWMAGGNRCGINTDLWTFQSMHLLRADRQQFTRTNWVDIYAKYDENNSEPRENSMVFGETMTLLQP